MASMMASTFALSRPSEKFGTHSTSVDIADKDKPVAGPQSPVFARRVLTDMGISRRKELPSVDFPLPIADSVPVHRQSAIDNRQCFSATTTQVQGYYLRH